MTKYHYKPSPLTQALILFVLAVIPLLLLVLVSWGEHTALNITQRIISTVTILGLSSLLWGFMRWNWIAIDQETVTVRSSFYKKSFKRRELSPVFPEPINLVMLGDWGWKRKKRAFSFPGYHSGHFKLRNDKTAFVSIIALEVMVYQLPDGSAFLLGVPEIERIAAEIAAR